MSSNDVLIIMAGAALASAALIVGLVSRSRSFDEGMRKVRLLVNVVMLGFFYAVLGGVVALFALGLVRNNTEYWWAGIFLLLVGFMLFRDMSARRRDVIREWMSRRPFRTRVQALKDETSSLLDDLANTKTDDSSRASAAPNAPDQDDARWVGGEGNDGVRTFKFEFHWPPRKRGS
jgi:hypothetical protein